MDELYCSRCGSPIPYNQAVFVSDGTLCQSCWNTNQLTRNDLDFVDWDDENEYF